MPQYVDAQPHSLDTVSPSGAAASSRERQPDEAGIVIECPNCAGHFILEDVMLRAVEPDPSPTLRLELDAPVDSLEQPVREVQRLLATCALRQANGVKRHAADALGVKYSTFWELLERLDLPDPEVDGALPKQLPALEDVGAVEIAFASDPDESSAIEVDVESCRGLMAGVVETARRYLARRALRKSGGNISRAADRLGLKYSTFYALLKRLRVSSLRRAAATPPATSPRRPRNATSRSDLGRGDGQAS